MQVTGTMFNIYHVCKRELWLHANGIRFEHTSEIVYDGKLIHEDSYPQRSERYEEVEIDGVKVDYYDAKNKVIHEIKRSNKVEVAHEWQLKYYIYVFERNGIDGCTGILEYPTQRDTKIVVLTDDDRERLKNIEHEILSLIESDRCPDINKKSICRSCSYFDFCYSSEPDQI